MDEKSEAASLPNEGAEEDDHDEGAAGCGGGGWCWCCRGAELPLALPALPPFAAAGGFDALPPPPDPPPPLLADLAVTRTPE